MHVNKSEISRMQTELVGKSNQQDYFAMTAGETCRKSDEDTYN